MSIFREQDISTHDSNSFANIVTSMATDSITNELKKEIQILFNKVIKKLFALVEINSKEKRFLHKKIKYRLMENGYYNVKNSKEEFKKLFEKLDLQTQDHIGYLKFHNHNINSDTYFKNNNFWNFCQKNLQSWEHI